MSSETLDEMLARYKAQGGRTTVCPTRNLGSRMLKKGKQRDGDMGLDAAGKSLNPQY